MKLLISLLLFIFYTGQAFALNDRFCFYPCTGFRPDTTGTRSLFGSDEPLTITLQGNVRDLLNDRGEVVKNHDLELSYTGESGAQFSMPVKVKTRGHFRKLSENCLYPPLLIQFTASDALQASVFNGHKKLKLVMPCRGDQYILREWMVYRLYNLITPKSLRARLVSVVLNDARKKKEATPFYGILLEEDDQMAQRNKAVLVNVKYLKPEQTEKNAFLTMAVFQYLIGNTDWSVQYRQNIRLIAGNASQMPAAVAYDFDHCGLVNAPYAQPATELQMRSVTERRYRGYCIPDMAQYAPVVELYNSLKPAIYELYANCPLLDAKYVKATHRYFDEFYATINDPKALQKQFAYPCDKNGTGNVVIKGLKKDQP